MKARVSLGALVLLAVIPSACSRAEARVVPEPPALDVPAAPARTVEAMAAEVPQPVGAPETVRSGTDELNRAAVPRPSNSTSGAAATRPEPRTDPTKTEVDPPKPAEEPRTPSPLQSAPTQREVELDAQIRRDLQRARDTLKRVDYRFLSADARAQYDFANARISLAEKELLARNLIYAKSLADSANTIASQLAPR